jgi:Tol biopolymer transport system component
MITTILSPGRKHLFYVVADSASSRKALWVRRLSDGRTLRIAPDLFLNPEMPVTGPGGGPYSGAELLYLEHRSGRLELQGRAPEGAPRLLRSFPANFTDRTGLGVHGKRVAWVDEVGDSSALVVAEGPNDPPRRVAVVPGRLLAPVWSPDGQKVAAYLSGRQRSAVLVIEVASTAQPSLPPRLIETGLLSGWNIKWLPDGQGVTVLGIVGQGRTTAIWLISLREGEAPVNLTRDEPSTMWTYSLSPDGRYVGYPAEMARGSAIWRIDLPR